MIYYLKEALDEAAKYRRFAPSAGYTWDFAQDDESEKKGEIAEQEEPTKGLRGRIGRIWLLDLAAIIKAT